jgi:hypothetical protein
MMSLYTGGTVFFIVALAAMNVLQELAIKRLEGKVAELELRVAKLLAERYLEADKPRSKG